MSNKIQRGHHLAKLPYNKQKKTARSTRKDLKAAEKKSSFIVRRFLPIVIVGSVLTILFMYASGNDTIKTINSFVLSRITTEPDIILITVDTLRADHLGCYGYPLKTSPAIDRFAGEALLFEKCLSHAPATGSSIASLMSGFLPHETTVYESNPLPEEIETLPEMLMKQGYTTVAVVSNYVLRKNRGYEQGFMVYDDTMDDRELVRKWPERIAKGTTDRAVELLKQHHRQRLFMWIHYQDPHGPYVPPDSFVKDFRRQDQKPVILPLNDTLSGCGGVPRYQIQNDIADFNFYLSRYEGEIRYLDEHFKRFLDALRELGLYDKALIIVSADHGEGLGEHDYFFAHGEYLYNHQIHVPLIIKYGTKLTGRSRAYVQHIDIIPTIRELLHLTVDSRFRGQNLFHDKATGREVLSEMYSPLARDGQRISLTADGLKFIYTPASKRYELFDLHEDPYEKNNLTSDTRYHGRMRDLISGTNRMLQEDFLKLPIKTNAPELTPEEKEKLESLGYVR